MPALAHWPLESQSWDMLPTHCLEPGLHTPHIPMSQTYEQVATGFHIMPSMLQTCAAWPTHRPVPGAQIPAHILVRHTKGHAAVVYCPLDPQVSRALPVHRVLPGAHIPMHAPAWQTKGHGIAALTQIPAVQV